MQKNYSSEESQVSGFHFLAAALPKTEAARYPSLTGFFFTSPVVGQTSPLAL
jgi:hypothetical protein